MRVDRLFVFQLTLFGLPFSISPAPRKTCTKICRLVEHTGLSTAVQVRLSEMVVFFFFFFFFFFLSYSLWPFDSYEKCVGTHTHTHTHTHAHTHSLHAHTHAGTCAHTKHTHTHTHGWGFSGYSRIAAFRHLQKAMKIVSRCILR